ncbi:MAG: hypothetical protein CVV22_07180 [Ignavibacteriae bacterium HGW-Ignavibacteriae-1]|jgi:hypothetical protein|nr:MAG: hypothetical protein CVV22_07180 [Ignavibacteriae bacterium HGW-Ignavibacteriae-1]
MIAKKFIFTLIFTFYLAIMAVGAENYTNRRPVPIVQTFDYHPVYLRRKPLRVNFALISIRN